MLYEASSLFPTYALPKLLRVRGRKWARLVKRVASLPETHPEHMAYTFLMRTLDDRLRPEEGHVCMMPGCVTCALDILERYPGSERDLIREYHYALDQVRSYLASLEKVQQVAIAA